MLRSLSVRDFALFSSVEFSPEEGFSALTGQTGAGKSLVVDALAFVTGGKKGREFIRHGAEKCEVTALFSPVTASQRAHLSSLGFEVGEEVLFSRTLSVDSRAVCRIDGKQTSLTLLREAARLFCDIHEQEDAQTLLSRSRHILYLDAFAAEDAFEAALRDYRACYEEYIALRTRFNELNAKNRADSKNEREFLQYQIRELENAGLRIGEEAELVQAKERLAFSKQLSDARALVQTSLDGEDGAYDRILRAADALSASSHVVAEWKELSEKLASIGAELSDVLRSVGGGEEIADPTAELDRIDARLSQLRRLYSLYAPSEEALLALLEEKKQALSALDSRKEELVRLHAEALAARERACGSAQMLRRLRLSAASRLEEAVLGELSSLDMPSVRFEVRFAEREKLSESGLDDVEFYIGTNVGQPTMPLSKIASGGELSRILLAIRCVLSRVEDVDTLVFDEIDTGVSGKSAVKIGGAMRRLGNTRQVLAVTHSAQVASAAHAQITVEKTVEGTETFATVRSLTEEGRIQELARILGGEEVTQTSLENAKELLKLGRK